MSKPDSYMRLSDAFLKRFDWKATHVTRERFLNWARTDHVPPIGIGDRQYEPLKKGQPVSASIVKAFSAFLTIHLGKVEHTVSSIAEACGAPGKNNVDLRPTSGGWTEMYAKHFGRRLEVPDEAFCADEADITLACVMIYKSISVQDGLKLSDGKALEYAEGITKRSLDQYAQTIFEFWKANLHSVMFSVLQRKDEAVRTGVTVVVPVKEEFYRSFKAGNELEVDIPASRLLHESEFLLGHAMAENRDIDVRRDKGSKIIAHSKANFYQLASLCPPFQSSLEPHLVTFAGTKENAKRLRLFGFRETGTNTPGAGKTIVEFAPPVWGERGADYPVASVEYWSINGVINMFQNHIALARKRYDA